MEWLIVENIRNLDKIEIDDETRQLLLTTFKKYYSQELEFRETMEKAIETRLELLKQGVKPELIVDESKASKITSKASSAPSKHDLESYEVIKILENRD